ncbi:MAG: DUF4345 family protein [Reyranella sp.]|uniref:DUF4345 family protein n=1 Tax=Reyranella sp. TaxID=1929291 RepID=UPI001AD30805|nr:DUF4345 family protein [Reyranella sp.]MBN9085938.1 DUF4345 family protein [Reyranella sp.]
MMNSSTVSLWLARLTIFAVAVLFTMIGLRFVLDPMHAAAGAGFVLQTAVGYTNARAGIGGFPLSLAAILAFSLFSAHRLLPALGLVATVAAVLLVLRLYGALHDGTLTQSMHIIVPELAIAALSLMGVHLERRRRLRAMRPCETPR